MWCGDVGRPEIAQMLQLRASLQHTMECAVILTDDPYLQVHIPIKDCEHQLGCMMVTQSLHRPLPDHQAHLQVQTDHNHRPPRDLRGGANGVPRHCSLPRRLLQPSFPVPGSFQASQQTTAVRATGDGYLLLRTGTTEKEEEVGDPWSGTGVECTHREHTLLPYSNCMGGDV